MTQPRAIEKLAARRFFAEGGSALPWQEVRSDRREWERFYRQRWQHDKVVRSTHGVNCTGSCSWKVHVKDGIITWETQQTDYPSNGPQTPDYEPRGCPRGASFSWYVYSPLRIKYPYVRGELLRLWRSARAEHDDPVDAWASIAGDPAKAARYQRARGKGGLARAQWDEVTELVAAAHAHTIERYGPDRCMAFSPIPAMSMASYSGGARFMSLIGGVCLSFYDWYADLPAASPQIWGDQTDVPESADWWDAGYLVMWGSNIPMTRTPDAHFMTEARYRGQKTVVVSPDYSDHTKFADQWLPAQPGTDAALAMAMGHVMLREFYVDRQVPYFQRYAKQFTDLAHLVVLDERDGRLVPGRFLRASDLGEGGEHDEWRTVVVDSAGGEPAVLGGSIGDRWGDEGKGRWNLELGEVDPALTLLGMRDGVREVALARFDEPGGGTVMRRGVPVRAIGGRLVTTVLDLLLAQYGVAREGLPGDWPASYADDLPYTPAWQEPITGVAAADVIRVAREFARNAERTEGRSMIVMGAGTNHWFHSDLIYRAMLNLVVLCGCQGRNGGGWAHYVGQEKARPITGLGVVAFATDWARPPRHQAATPFFYLATDQWRYDRLTAEDFVSPLAPPDASARRHAADANALAARLGWLPSYPTFDRNPLELVAAAEAEGVAPGDYVVRELKAGRLRFACEDPDAPENFPRVMTVWRSNLLGASAKGHEYFLKHLLGVTTAAVRNEEAPPEDRPDELLWREQAPEGKVDLLTAIDFRMNGTCLHADVVLPAATWYEKEDISTTDLHPFVHAFNPAITPPWETRTDWDIFRAIAEAFDRVAGERLGVRRDLVAAPLLHDTPDELAQPLGEVRDWRAGDCEPVPGRTMPKLVVVERDYGAVGERFGALGPLVENAGIAWKGVAFDAAEEVEYLKAANGATSTGRPRLETAAQACETIMALSGATNGRLAVQGFRTLELRTGTELADLAIDRAEDRHSFRDVSIQPRKTITSPEWSGIESRDRRYSPFCVNVDRAVPWRTLTGRQQFYCDHEWLRDYGEGLAAYKPPLDMAHRLGADAPDDESFAVAVRYLTPHSKWSVHSTYQDNLHMLTLFRGGPVVWMSPGDADKARIADNDWIEMYNRNGVVAARAVVSHRIPEGCALMYHAQDRHINVPISEVSGTRGGTHNSVTQVQMKPTLMVGGYAQLSYGFNYYGPTGCQRDEVTVIRKRRSEVTY
jgi:nitrate reductase / nitrite oxidoreductase, alpha subunit